MAAPQIFNPALQGDIGAISADGAAAAANVDFKALGNKLVGLLPASGPIVSQPDYYTLYNNQNAYAERAPVINTKYGQVPLTNNLTPEGRQRFLPTLKTLVAILEKPTLSPAEVNQLLELSRNLNLELNSVIPSVDF